GSTDGKDWKTVDTRSGESFSARFQTKSYDLAEPAEYQHFRLDVSKNNGGDILQLADVQFSTGGSTAPVPEDMLSLVDRGPSGAPAPAKAGAGFTGTRALRYAGRHTATGRGLTRTTRSSTWTWPSARTPSCRTRSSRRWRPTARPRLRKTPRTSPWTSPSPTAPISAASARATRTASRSPAGAGRAAEILYVNQCGTQRPLADRFGRGRQDRRPGSCWPTTSPGEAGEVPRAGSTRREPQVGRARVAEGASRRTTRRPPARAGNSHSGSFLARQQLPRDRAAAIYGFSFWTPVTNSSSLSWLLRLLAGEQRRQPADAPGAQPEP
ncbi:hypothetical protein ACRAWF_12995, partial [Streptomyces sp. L7]